MSAIKTPIWKAQMGEATSAISEPPAFTAYC